MPLRTALSSVHSCLSIALVGADGFWPKLPVLARAADVWAEGASDARRLSVLSRSAVFSFLFCRQDHSSSVEGLVCLLRTMYESIRIRFLLDILPRPSPSPWTSGGAVDCSTGVPSSVTSLFFGLLRFLCPPPATDPRALALYRSRTGGPAMISLKHRDQRPARLIQNILFHGGTVKWRRRSPPRLSAQGLGMTDMDG